MDKCTMLKYIAASPNLTSYVAGASVTLMCVVHPDLLFLSFFLSFFPPFLLYANINEIYLWECDGCFANGRTDMALMRVLTKRDSSMINCSATIDSVVYKTDMPFYLQVTQGT